MAKKNNQIDENEITGQIPGEPVDSTVNPDGITIEPSTGDSEKITIETDNEPVQDSTDITEQNIGADENPTDSESVVTENSTDVDVIPPTDNEQPDQEPVDTTKQPTDLEPVGDENLADVIPPTDKNPTPVTNEAPVTEKDEKETKTTINEFKKFNIRFGFSIDSRSTTGRKLMSTAEIVKQFVSTPTCFIAFENEDDLKSFAEILKIKKIKVPDNEGKLVDFADKVKDHLIDRISEHSKYWISKNTK